MGKPSIYTIWHMAHTFTKGGAPLCPGFGGGSIREVIIMEKETFLRMIEEHPSLRNASFRVGQFDPREDTT